MSKKDGVEEAIGGLLDAYDDDKEAIQYLSLIHI